ncbi:DUF2500 family protein [uncultured Oscillibacter sp.]|uniref:DUF2500 family protein n=1 Tax=uncultured Oscillibacter sp. TaxID=876091 RepID=UPI002616E7F4|nr:DUF2500 family protein [uncultured Oscillibacter sp.]
MKFLKHVFWIGIMLLTWQVAILLVWECIPYLPQWLMRFFTGSEFGRFFFELFLNVAVLGIVYGLQRWIQRLYLQSKGQEIPAPKSWQKARKQPSPPQTVPAAVTGRRTKTRQRPRSRPELSHHIGFRLADGTEVWLSVSEQEYRRLSEGDRGRLTFQPEAPLPERRYVSFLRDGEGVSGP